MQVGDLVLLNTLDDVGVPNGTLGVIVGVDIEGQATLPAQGMVQWNGHNHWSIVYSDQVVVLSENR